MTQKYEKWTIHLTSRKTFLHKFMLRENEKTIICLFDSQRLLEHSGFVKQLKSARSPYLEFFHISPLALFISSLRVHLMVFRLWNWTTCFEYLREICHDLFVFSARMVVREMRIFYVKLFLLFGIMCEEWIMRFSYSIYIVGLFYIFFMWFMARSYIYLFRNIIWGCLSSVGDQYQ